MFENMMPALVTRRAMFWLDAHSHGFGCTLPEEVATVMRLFRGGYIFMDDFQVPGHPELGYDIHKDMEIGWELIKEHVEMDKFLKIGYPHYQTGSESRGWGVIAFGDLPEEAMVRFAKL